MTLAILVSLVAVVIICNLVGWTEFVYHPQSCSSQSEANCIINLRLGGTQVSWGTKVRLRKRRGVKWFNPFPIRLEFWRPPSQCNMVEVFCIGCRWLALSYTTRGETKPGSVWWNDTGLHFEGTIVRSAQPCGGILGALFCWLPTRMWLTGSPDGGGPWLPSPEGAAEFIRCESARDNGYEDPEDVTKACVSVIFLPDEIKRLWLPGRVIERAGWSIKCIVIPRWRLPEEWNGW